MAPGTRQPKMDVANRFSDFLATVLSVSNKHINTAQKGAK
jgi:hypothetical protein